MNVESGFRGFRRAVSGVSVEIRDGILKVGVVEQLRYQLSEREAPTSTLVLRLGKRSNQTTENNSEKSDTDCSTAGFADALRSNCWELRL